MNFDKHIACASLPALLSGACFADFSGPYAPEQWTFTAGPGGILAEHRAAELVLIGGDRAMFGYTDITVSVVADGEWSFSFAYTSLDTTPGVDGAYYLINGEAVFLADTSAFGPPVVGAKTVTVRTGDIIGFRVETSDGIFGPGTLIVTDFSAPVPAPVASLLLLGFGLRPTRQRQGDPL